MKINRVTSLITTFTMIILTSLILSGCEEQNDTASKLKAFMTAYNNNHSYKYSGAILVAQGDRILLNEGYGMANYEENISNTSDSVFAIGSITKSFTAIGIMQLQEKGLLNVDDPMSKYIDGNKRGDDITIGQLLTHTSGLVRDGLLSGQEHVSLEENIDFINTCAMLFEPGEDYSYSNAGYQVLAAIIEKASGQSYNDYIHDNIFIPLKMDQSRGGRDASYGNNQSIGYTMTTNDPRQFSIYNFSSIIGSGNLYSTVGDLYKYDRGLDGETLLSKNSLDEIFSPHWGTWDNGYGYGWETTEKYGHRRFSHGGNIAGGGYVSSMIRYPEDDYVLLFLTNNEDATALNIVSETMEAIIFGEDYVIPEKVGDVKVDSEILKQYAGVYEFDEGFLLSVSYKDDKLYSPADDGNTYELIPISETRFHYEDHQCTLGEFITDDNGVTYKIRSRTNPSIVGQKVEARQPN